jgi:ATP-dependent RNA helicase DOB1
MATPKRKADDDADLDESAAKQARLVESQGVAEDGTAEEEPAANGKGYVACLHEVSYPEGSDHARAGRVPSSTKPAKEYPFTLDPFQREAVRCLEAGESVLVRTLWCSRLLAGNYA